MSLPVRCFTCGNIIGQHEIEYNKKLKEGFSINKILDSLELESYCCRRMFIGYVNVLDTILLFPDRVFSSDKEDLLEHFYENKLKTESTLNILSESPNSSLFPLKKMYIVHEIEEEKPINYSDGGDVK